MLYLMLKRLLSPEHTKLLFPMVVNYSADHYNGYVADVKYEGVPVYPEAKPTTQPPAKPGYYA